MKNNTLICGSIAYDTIMVFPDQFKNHILPDQVHILNVSFSVNQMRKEFGGCAGNIAYALKLLGGNPLPMGTVGLDFSPYEKWMDEQGIDRRYVKAFDDIYTAQCFITTDMDDNQITAFHMGAMANAAQNKHSGWHDLSLGIVSPDAKDGMVQNAKDFAAHQTPFVFDPGQGLPMFDGADLEQMLDLADYVIVNDYESRLMEDKTGLSVTQMAAKVKAMIVTLGAQGAHIYHNGQIINIAPIKVDNAVDPTGCGDAFRGALLHGLNKKMDWQAIGQMGCLMGALKVATQGTQNYSFTKAEFETAYEQHYGSQIEL